MAGKTNDLYTADMEAAETLIPAKLWVQAHGGAAQHQPKALWYNDFVLP